MQTFAGQLLTPPAPPSSYEVIEVALEDGDRLLLHADGVSGTKPVVVLFHGLGGSSESSYMLRLSFKLTALGHPVVRFNHRGCGAGGEALAAGIYHAGRAADLAAALAAVGGRFPGAQVQAVGFSLSANMLLKLLADQKAMRALPHVTRALAVCPPVDLEMCSVALDSRRNRVIDRYYTRRMIATAHAKKRAFPAGPAPEFPRRMTLRLFDEVYTAPRAGFPSRKHYYEAASSKHNLFTIGVPTTVLAAADDPIIPEASFAGVRWSSAVAFQLTRTGGHMGFIAARRTRFGDLRWMDLAVVEWVEAGG